MAHNTYIQQELQSIAPNLIGLNANVYVTPNLYFEELPATVIQVIKNCAALPTLQIVKPNVPANYFENLPNQILAKIKHQESETYLELEAIAPTLNSISRQMPYSLPANYFEHFKAVTTNKEQAKIVAMHKPLKWARYAVAACIVGLLAVGSYLFVSNKQVKQNHTVAANTNVVKSLEALPAQELEKGIEATKPFIMATEVATNNAPIALPTVEESLDFIPTDALENYLNENDNTSLVEDGMN